MSEFELSLIFKYLLSDYPYLVRSGIGKGDDYTLANLEALEARFKEYCNEY